MAANAKHIGILLFDDVEETRCDRSLGGAVL